MFIARIYSQNPIVIFYSPSISDTCQIPYTMLSIKSYRKKDSVILLALISSLAGVAFMTTMSPCYINGVTSKARITTNNNNTTTATATATTTNNLITNILAKNLENHLQKTGAILEITSKLPQMRNVSYAHLLNQTLKTLHGIHPMRSRGPFISYRSIQLQTIVSTLNSVLYLVIKTPKEFQQLKIYQNWNIPKKC
jgi:hypothetical protein